MNLDQLFQKLWEDYTIQNPSTVSVNHLNSFKGIEKVNQYLKDQHLSLNSSGGEVKGSGEELLKQSSVMST